VKLIVTPAPLFPEYIPFGKYPEVLFKPSQQSQLIVREKIVTPIKVPIQV
jgi:hypothetical protein